MHRRTATILLAATICGGCGLDGAGSGASALVGTGTKAATALSGASRSTTGTIDNPGSSPAMHDREWSEQAVAASLADLGFERVQGIAIETRRFTAAGRRDDVPVRLAGEWLPDHGLDLGSSPPLNRRLTALGYRDVGTVTRVGRSASLTATRGGTEVTLHIDDRRGILVEARPERRSVAATPQ